MGIYHVYSCRREKISVNQHLCLIWELQFTIVDSTLNGITEYDTVIHSVLVRIVVVEVCCGNCY